VINLFIAILVEKLIITEKEGEALALHFNSSMLPSNFKEMLKMVRKVLQKVNIEK
jgi:hypothetical protein